jgi:hypothetical protein
MGALAHMHLVQQNNTAVSQSAAALSWLPAMWDRQAAAFTAAGENTLHRRAGTLQGASGRLQSSTSCALVPGASIASPHGVRDYRGDGVPLSRTNGVSRAVVQVPALKWGCAEDVAGGSRIAGQGFQKQQEVETLPPAWSKLAKKDSEWMHTGVAGGGTSTVALPAVHAAHAGTRGGMLPGTWNLPARSRSAAKGSKGWSAGTRTAPQQVPGCIRKTGGHRVKEASCSPERVDAGSTNRQPVRLESGQQPENRATMLCMPRGEVRTAHSRRRGGPQSGVAVLRNDPAGMKQATGSVGLLKPVSHINLTR